MRVIRLPYLVIDFSGLRSEFADDGYSPRWAGKVRLEVDNGFGWIDVVTANWSGLPSSRLGKIADFEGESDDASLYAACKAHAETIERAIADALPAPCAWDAHNADVNFRRAHKMPPFHLEVRP